MRNFFVCLGVLTLLFLSQIIQAQPKDSTITFPDGGTLVVTVIDRPIRFLPGGVSVNPAVVNRRNILHYLGGLPDLPALPSSEVHTPLGSSTQTVEGVVYTLRKERADLTDNFSVYSVLSPTMDVMYPGCLIQTKSLIGNQLAPVPLAAAPGTITITNLLAGNPGVSSSEPIPEPNLANYENARTTVLNRLNPRGSVNASDWQYTHARTAEQAMINLGLSFKNSSLSASFKGSYSQDLKTNTIVARLVQKYYTVSFAPNDSYFFAGSVALADLKRYSGNDNPPGYISQVTYGRILVMTFEAQESITDMKAALDAAYNGGFSLSGSLSTEQKRVLQSMSVKVSEVGGNGEAVMKLLTNPFGGDLNNYLLSGATFSNNNQGAPIQFTVRYLKNSTIAKTSLTTSYTEVVDFSAPDEHKTLYVSECPTCDRVWTGINIAPGDRVDLFGYGQIWAGVWATGTNGPEGWKTWESKPAYPISGWGCPPFALIAKIGTGNWMCIGASNTITGSQRGQLILSTNDDNVKNGNGTFQVVADIYRRTASQLGYHGVGKSD